MKDTDNAMIERVSQSLLLDDDDEAVFFLSCSFFRTDPAAQGRKATGAEEVLGVGSGRTRSANSNVC